MSFGAKPSVTAGHGLSPRRRMRAHAREAPVGPAVGTGTAQPAPRFGLRGARRKSCSHDFSLIASPPHAVTCSACWNPEQSRKWCERRTQEADVCQERMSGTEGRAAGGGAALPAGDSRLRGAGSTQSPSSVCRGICCHSRQTQSKCRGAGSSHPRPG